MKKQLLAWLCCPYCKGELNLEIVSEEAGEVKEGMLKCPCSKKYPIKKFIPRFVDSDCYTNSFSFEWQKNMRTQLDSANTNTIMKDTSKKQFQQRIDFPLEALKDKLILDVGCGIGRYVEVAAKFGANAIGVDLSYSIDCAYKNLGFLKNVQFVQADIFRLPFKEGVFDFVFSFGVLHHTSNCKEAFKRLAPLLKKGGNISIFVYSSYNKAIVYSSAFWRSITTRLPKRLLYYFSHISVVLYFLYKLPVIGQLGRAIFVIPMWPNWRWRVLDTFDWYSPKYQSKHTHWEVYNWFRECGLSNIAIHPHEVTLSATK
jgi:SAM-dependent methyltransferase